MHLLVRARALIPQHAMDGVNLNVPDAVKFRQLRLEGVHQLARGAYDEDSDAPLGRTRGDLEQHRRLAKSRTTRNEETPLVQPLLLFVVQGCGKGHSADHLLLAR